MGFATIGAIGFEGRIDYGAIGNVTNLAARLCGEATGGEILLAPRVAAALDDAIAVEPAGEFTLKGLARPIAVSEWFRRPERPPCAAARRAAAARRSAS